MRLQFHDFFAQGKQYSNIVGTKDKDSFFANILAFQTSFYLIIACSNVRFFLNQQPYFFNGKSMNNSNHGRFQEN